jgi:hypothetical protein
MSLKDRSIYYGKVYLRYLNLLLNQKWKRKLSRRARLRVMCQMIQIMGKKRLYNQAKV